MVDLVPTTTPDLPMSGSLRSVRRCFSATTPRAGVCMGRTAREHPGGVLPEHEPRPGAEPIAAQLRPAGCVRRRRGGPPRGHERHRCRNLRRTRRVPGLQGATHTAASAHISRSRCMGSRLQAPRRQRQHSGGIRPQVTPARAGVLSEHEDVGDQPLRLSQMTTWPVSSYSIHLARRHKAD